MREGGITYVRHTGYAFLWSTPDLSESLREKGPPRIDDPAIIESAKSRYAEYDMKQKQPRAPLGRLARELGLDEYPELTYEEFLRQDVERQVERYMDELKRQETLSLAQTLAVERWALTLLIVTALFAIPFFVLKS